MVYMLKSMQESAIPLSALFAYYFGDNYKIISKKMTESSEIDIEDDSIIYIVDYTFTTSTLKCLVSLLHQSKKIVWIDNHTSSIQSIKRLMEMNVDLSNLEAILDKKSSSIQLLWNYFYPEKNLPVGLKLISNWDNYEIDNETRELHYGLIVNPDYENIRSRLWVDIIENHSPILEYLFQVGRGVVRYQKISEINELKSIFICKLEDDTECAILNSIADKYTFDIAYNLFDICISYVYNGKTYDYNVFSRGDRAGLYARKHGGPKKCKKHYGHFELNRNDHDIYWDFLNSNYVSSLYSHPKYKEYVYGENE